MRAPTLASPAAEIRRLRAEVAQLQAALASDARSSDPDYWLALFRSGYEAQVAEVAEAEYRRGQADEARHRDRLWREAAEPIAHGGPTFAELERRRWGPGGRVRFGDAREGDYMGGPVPTW